MPNTLHSTTHKQAFKPQNGYFSPKILKNRKCAVLYCCILYTEDAILLLIVLIGAKMVLCIVWNVFFIDVVFIHATNYAGDGNVIHENGNVIHT